MSVAVEVRCNGKSFRGFNSVNVVRSMDQIAATYSLGVFRETSDAQPFMVPVLPDDSVEVLLDGEVVISGYNETTVPTLGPDSCSCVISGKESTVDLVKCGCPELVFQNKKVDEIVRRICSGLGIGYSSTSGIDFGSPLKSISAKPGVKAFDFIRQVCKERRVFPVGDGLGKVSFFSKASGSASVALVQGKNIVAMQGNFSNAERYSKYRVVSAHDSKGKTYAEALDDQVQRQREWVVMDNQVSTKENCLARAQWEAHHRQAASNSLSVTVIGWRQKPDGPLWAPGILVTAEIPAFGVNDQFLINRVNYTFGSSGIQSTLQLVPPDLYEQAPAFAKKKKMKKNIYASIAKQTGSKLR